MFAADVRERIEQELARGEEARRQGLEGRARVCARRAAAAAARAYFEGRDGAGVGMNAVRLLEALQEAPELPDEVKQSAALLLTRVNEAYELPVNADLLAEARRLIGALDRPG